MSARHLGRLATAAALLLPAAAEGGSDLVLFPEEYRDRFVVYGTVDRPDRGIVRYFYVNPEALAAARPGAPMPDGTVLIMEDRTAVMDASGSPARGPDGRMVATDEIGNVFVQEKRAGWGAEYPPEKRNGEWEYAQFLADGSRKADAKIDNCFACHKSRAGQDFTFIFAPFVEDAKR